MGDTIKEEKDLKKYNIRTDLAIDEIENKKIKGLTYKMRTRDSITVTKVYLKENNILNKKQGNYITLEFEDCTDSSNKEKLINTLTIELKKLIKVKKNDLVLIIGLGNIDCTPDSLGPLTVKQITVTNHIYIVDELDDNYNRVATFIPGVMGTTGLETLDVISGIADIVKPSLIIVIDSLATNQIEKLNKTIQITDTGIHPGSGINNKRKEISEEILGIPVIAIGIPTVIDYGDNYIIISKETDYMIKELSNIISLSINKVLLNKH